MPVKLGSKLPTDSYEARIEIVPLIDIMFFLLAAFMLVSLSMVNMRGMKVNLPTATTATPDVSTKDFCNISIDAAGGAFFNKQAVTDGELVRNLTSAHRLNPNLRVILSGDRDARHGSVIHILDLVRAGGIDKIAFETNPTVSVESAAPSGSGAR